MIDRPHAFGEQRYSLLDNLIFTLRKRRVMAVLPRSVSGTMVDLGSGYDARLLVELLAQYPKARGVAVDMAFMPALASVPRLVTHGNNLDEALRLPSGSAEVCLSLAVLEHLNEPQAFLGEVYRLLAPGGILALTTPGPSSQWLLELLAFRCRVIDADEIRDHKNYFSSSDLTRMCVAAGFAVENVRATRFLWGMNNLLVATK